MKTDWPVIVVGAGPAGATTAYLLARAGVEVLLVDRATFPRGKVCGCCLNPWALATLRAVGLGEVVPRLGGVALNKLNWACGGRSATVPLPHGAALSRRAFDMGLIEAAVAAGARFWPQTSAALCADREGGESAFRGDRFPTCPAAITELEGHQRGDWPGTSRLDRLETCPHARDPLRPQTLGARQGRRLRLQNERGTTEVSTRVVIVADGLGGQFLAHEPQGRPQIAAQSRIGAGAVAAFASPFFAPGAIYMASGVGGYVGLVRLEDGTLDLAAALDPVAVKRWHVAETVRRILARSGWPEWPDPATLTWHGTPPLTRQPGAVAGHRLFLIGDASGYVEPFTGEGMGWALASAAAVVPFVLQGVNEWHDELAAGWKHQHRQLFAAARRRCRLVATLLRSRWLSALTVGLLAHFPSLARPFIPAQGVA